MRSGSTILILYGSAHERFFVVVMSRPPRRAPYAAASFDSNATI
jgi:hypothetical protein